MERNDSEHLRQVLPELLKPYRQARRIHLIWDGGPSHTAEDTLALLPTYRPQACVLFTPAPASWLNEAELLLRSFEAHYLRQGSWKSRCELIEHVYDSAPEYNRPFAYPIQWSWI